LAKENKNYIAKETLFEQYRNNSNNNNNNKYKLQISRCKKFYYTYLNCIAL